MSGAAAPHHPTAWVDLTPEQVAKISDAAYRANMADESSDDTYDTAFYKAISAALREVNGLAEHKGANHDR
jgi:hypothetical protein